MPRCTTGSLDASGAGAPAGASDVTPSAASDTDQTRWLAPAFAAAAIALGRALQIASGSLTPVALIWVTIALLLALGGVIARRPLRWARFDGRVVPIVAAIGLIAQLAQLYGSNPGWFIVLDPAFLTLFNGGLVAFAAIGAAFVSGPSRTITKVLVAALVIVHFAIGAAVIRHSPRPPIDVDVFQRQSIRSFLKGVDPYAITFPNIYRHSEYYGPGVSVNGRLQFGFPYPPMSLLVSLPGDVLAKDHRYAALVAMELAAILMAFARPRGFGPLAAVLYLTTPRVFYVLEMSWTEPLVVLGLSLVVYAACRHRRAVPWLFGLFIALKQYLVFAIPPVLLLVGRPWQRRSVVRLLSKAALVSAGVTLPFVLWGPGAFMNSVVTLQFRQPFRSDALSFLAWWASIGHAPPSSAIAFGVAAAASALAVWRLPRTAAGFAAAVALTFLVFFSFNKQAFANYYFFVIGALCVTVAACERPAGSPAAAGNDVALASR